MRDDTYLVSDPLAFRRRRRLPGITFHPFLLDILVVLLCPAYLLSAQARKESSKI